MATVRKRSGTDAKRGRDPAWALLLPGEGDAVTGGSTDRPLQFKLWEEVQKIEVQ
jgi:hypothetical protein